MYTVHIMMHVSAGSQVFNYFVNRMAAISTKLGRQTIFWDEPWRSNETGTSSLKSEPRKTLACGSEEAFLSAKPPKDRAWYSLLLVLLVSLSLTMFDLILVALVVWKVSCAGTLSWHIIGRTGRSDPELA